MKRRPLLTPDEEARELYGTSLADLLEQLEYEQWRQCKTPPVYQPPPPEETRPARAVSPSRLRSQRPDHPPGAPVRLRMVDRALAGHGPAASMLTELEVDYAISLGLRREFRVEHLMSLLTVGFDRVSRALAAAPTNVPTTAAA